MEIKKNQIISIIIFAFILSSTPSSNLVGRTNDSSLSFTPTAITGHYREDFVNTTFMDPSSVISGWGNGTLTSTRDFSCSLLDFYATSYPVYDVDVQG